MRPLRNFKTNQCCHLFSRIANHAFFLNDEEKTWFVERLWRVAAFPREDVRAGPRAALGIVSANFFTAHYLTPLAMAGYIAVEGGETNRYSPDKRYKLLRKGKAEVCA